MTVATLPAAPAAATGIPNGERLHEMIDGRFVEKTVSIYASWIATRLSFLLAEFVEPNALGTVVTEGVFILTESGHLRRRPDVAFISAQRWPFDRPIPEQGDWNVVPDLAVEVVSPNDAMFDVVAKVHEYFDQGCRQVWLVLSSVRAVYVYSRPDQIRVFPASAELTADELFPGWKLPIARLFHRSAAPA